MSSKRQRTKTHTLTAADLPPTLRTPEQVEAAARHKIGQLRQVADLAEQFLADDGFPSGQDGEAVRLVFDRAVWVAVVGLRVLDKVRSEAAANTEGK